MPLSPIVNRKITTWVYLPPGYDKSTERYPVIYLLHGQPGGWTDCYLSGRVEEMADKLISKGQMRPAILVAFDADGPKGPNDMTNFCNRVTDGYRAEDFICNELVPYTDANYRTLPDAKSRALWGYSAGGFGALNLGLHHPGLWDIWASHAGYYQASDDAKTMTKILGPQEQNQALWNANSPLVTVKQLPASEAKNLHVYMDASPKEEDYDGYLTMTSELEARGVDADTISRSKAHAWRVITQNCRDSLLFINKNWAQE